MILCFLTFPDPLKWNYLSFIQEQHALSWISKWINETRSAFFTSFIMQIDYLHLHVYLPSYKLHTQAHTYMHKDTQSFVKWGMLDAFSFSKFYLSSVLISKLATQEIYVLFSVLMNNQERIILFGQCQNYQVPPSTNEKLVFIIREKISWRNRNNTSSETNTSFFTSQSSSLNTFLTLTFLNC